MTEQRGVLVSDFYVLLHIVLRQTAFVLSGVNCLTHWPTLGRRNFRQHRCLECDIKQQSLTNQHREFLDVKSVLHFQVTPFQVVQACSVSGLSCLLVSLFATQDLAAAT